MYKALSSSAVTLNPLLHPVASPRTLDMPSHRAITQAQPHPAAPVRCVSPAARAVAPTPRSVREGRHPPPTDRAFHQRSIHALSPLPAMMARVISPRASRVRPRTMAHRRPAAPHPPALPSSRRRAHPPASVHRAASL
ncbi:hypothetical protein HYPSUDRAFT_763709 [Hypholoma sublateritium FD-334 SS-4]|uniref:Uncharacterized protein n=1 Tax=Hypholoma sublateritium (strain FD-334 SS-4) TaxID=945553 RepID=A0A0D2L2J8_HYPSF|nr:hypothetical protein HYPSUDRAFT_763709 [Hypholoma sublateritium FD-334 SS-4]